MTWITGEDILKRERWGLEKDLTEAYNLGLSPYREFDGARMDVTSKCFNCKKANQGYMPGRVDEQGDVCHPLQLTAYPRPGLQLPHPRPSYARAKAIDPELAEHSFIDGAFVFKAGVIDITNARQWRFLTEMIGPDMIDHLIFERVCDKAAPMGYLYMGDRLKAAKFKLKEVEEYEGRHGIGSGVATEPGAIGPEQGQQVEAVPHFATASDLLEYHRGRGVHELHNLARLVDEEFTGSARLTDETLGRLLPANPGMEITAEGHKRQGHRLRKAYQ